MPYNNPIKKKDSACKQLKSETGKPSGLMMEGSVNHMSMLHKETDKQEKKDLLKDMPIDDKASAIEMSPYKMHHEGSPNKMSPLNDNHWKIDPKTGKKVDEFGTPIPEDFVSSTAPYEPMDAPGTTQEYNPEAASNRFFDQSRRVDEALNIAQNLLTGGTSANLGHVSTDFPYAAGNIVGKTYTDGGRYINTSVEPTQANINRLRDINRSNPQQAFNEISTRTSRMSGDAASDWQREVDPLNQFKKMRSGRNIERKTLGTPGQTLYEKTMAKKNRS